jgi:hypothetical protein
MQCTNYEAHYVLLSTFLLPRRSNLFVSNIHSTEYYELKMLYEFGLSQKVSSDIASTFIL